MSSSLEEGPTHPYEGQEAQLPSALLEELFGLTLLIGRLKDLPANLQSAFTMQNQGKVVPHGPSLNSTVVVVAAVAASPLKHFIVIHTASPFDYEG